MTLADDKLAAILARRWTRDQVIADRAAAVAAAMAEQQKLRERALSFWGAASTKLRTAFDATNRRIGLGHLTLKIVWQTSIPPAIASLRIALIEIGPGHVIADLAIGVNETGILRHDLSADTLNIVDATEADYERLLLDFAARATGPRPSARVSA